MVKPLLVFDFDGVFNPLNHYLEWVGEGKPTELDYIFQTTGKWKVSFTEVSNETHFAPDRTEKVEFEGKPVHISWSTELIAEVNNIIASEVADVMWLSTWRDKTGTVLNPTLGVNLSVDAWVPPTHRSGNRYFTDSYDYHQRGKWFALQDFFALMPTAEKPPVAWFDDVATLGLENFEETTNNVVSNDFNVPALVFLTDPESGISRAQWAAMLNWIKQNS